MAGEGENLPQNPAYEMLPFRMGRLVEFLTSRLILFKIFSHITLNYKKIGFRFVCIQIDNIQVFYSLTARKSRFNSKNNQIMRLNAQFSFSIKK